jgi:hypothetical protein
MLTKDKLELLEGNARTMRTGERDLKSGMVWAGWGCTGFELEVGMFLTKHEVSMF